MFWESYGYQGGIAWIFGFLGLSICTLGFIAFKQAKTTVNPLRPQISSSLVASGVYRYTRNPMYLGFLLLLTGWAAGTASLMALLVLPAFVFYLIEFQTKPEERALLSIFGDEFKAYCSTVRRWV